MILTVCPNTAMDKVLFIEEWTPGIPMRTDRIINSVGGKGLNSAIVLGQLGVDAVGLGFFAGDIGRELADLTASYHVQVDPVWVDGSNRISHVIAERKTRQQNHVIGGNPIVSPAQAEELAERYGNHLKNADWVVLAGTLPHSLPDDFYVPLIHTAHEAGVHVLIDAQKAFMREAVRAKPHVTKMNREEFGWTFNMEFDPLPVLRSNVMQMRREYGLEDIVITLGSDGILAVTGDSIYHAKAPEQQVVNAAGAGDAVSAVLAWRLSQEDNWENALRWAAAVSASAVTTERTGDIDTGMVDDLFDATEIKQLG